MVNSIRSFAYLFIHSSYHSLLGKIITSHEIEVLGQLKLRIRDHYERSYSNDWLKTATDLDLLKFIRISRESDVMGALLNHNKWRNSIYGNHLLT